MVQLADHVCRLGAVGLLACFQIPLAGSPPGTEILNVATLDYSIGDKELSESAQARFTTAQILDLEVECLSTHINVFPGESGVVSTWRLKNLGNGPDTVRLTVNNAAGSNDFIPSLVSIWLDDGDGIFQGSGVDTLYSSGGNDPQLASDEEITVFVLNDIPGGLNDGDAGSSELRAVSTYQSDPLDPVGTVYSDAGPGGVDVIIGNSEAADSDLCLLRILSIQVSLEKSNFLLAEYNTNTVLPGGVLTEPVPGAVVTYSLTVTAVGNGTASNVVVSDVVPDGTTYAPGNFTLNGFPLTEAIDSDLAQFVGGEIMVGIPAMSDGDSHTVTFNVTID